jgi:hypothetical protein
MFKQTTTGKEKIKLVILFCSACPYRFFFAVPVPADFYALSGLTTA